MRGEPARRHAGALAALGAALVVSGCAAKVIPLPPPGVARFPEFVKPGVPPPLTTSRAAVSQERGWRFLQVGDVQNAEREFRVALAVAPAFHPAEAGLGYVDMARGDATPAVGWFDRALRRDRAYVSALVGRGQALLSLARADEALSSFELALAADPALTEIRARVEVLRFRSVREGLEAARAAAAAGRFDEAVRAYQHALAASPESAVLYRELAAVERRQGNADRALEHFRQAVALDPSDVRSLVQVSELLDDRRDFDGAIQALTAALAFEPSSALEDRLGEMRARAELARLPDRYRAIPAAPQITRADLAALIGVRLATLLQTSRRREGVVVTDSRASWASSWITSVSRAGVMDPYPNHTFQPNATVRRADLAQAVSRLLNLIAGRDPTQAKTWQSGRKKIADLVQGHLVYPAASLAVAAGVMTLMPNDTFQPSRPVSGAEAIQTLERLETLAGLARPRPSPEPARPSTAAQP